MEGGGGRAFPGSRSWDVAAVGQDSVTQTQLCSLLPTLQRSRDGP